MNSAFVGYEELSRSRRVLSTSAFGLCGKHPPRSAYFFIGIGGCYPPRPSASVENTLLDLLNSSYPTQPHSLIAKY